MEELPHELAVSRATLYRAVDGRDRLLGDVLWSLAERTYEQARREVRSRGVDAILEISDRFTETLTAAGPFRRFLECEPQTALRVLLTPAGGVHERAVALQREIFAEAFRGREDEVGGPRHAGVPLRATARVDPVRGHHERATSRSGGGAAGRPRAARLRLRVGSHVPPCACLRRRRRGRIARTRRGQQSSQVVETRRSRDHVVEPHARTGRGLVDGRSGSRRR